MSPNLDPVACPVCDRTETGEVIRCTDYTVSKKQFAIRQCNDCRLRFTWPVPDEGEIGAYYQSDAYISHSDSDKGLINKLYKIARNYTLQWKLRLVKQESRLSAGRLSAGRLSAGRLLDIGCGTGAFLNTMQQAGWKVTGLEPDSGARTLAGSNYGLAVHAPDQLFGLPAGSFDVITMWHVLEHVHRLHAYIRQIRNLLTPEGVALIAVPNYTSNDARHYQEYWAAYDVPRHLYHFSPQSIQTLMEQHGLKVAATKPMKLDAYYIAMLSEQYRHGKGNLLAAAWYAFQSNRYASRHPDAYSSLVYVIRK